MGRGNWLASGPVLCFIPVSQIHEVKIDCHTLFQRLNLRPDAFRRMKLKGVITCLTLAIMAFCGSGGNSPAQVTFTNVNHTDLGNGGTAQGLAVSNNVLYLADNTDGLQILSVTNPPSPGILGSANDDPADGAANAVAVAGNDVYLANEGDGLRVYDVSNPDSPASIGYADETTNGNGYANGVAVSGSYAFVANSGDGLRVYNVSTPSNPVNVGHINNGGYANAVAVSGNYAYLANDTDGLRIYNIANPSNPVNVGHTYNGGSANSLVVSGNYLYLANGSDGLRIYNISNPTNAISVGETNNGGFAEDVAVSGSYAYLANYTDGLRVYNVSNPANPLNVGNAVEPSGLGAAYGITVSGNYAFLANGDDGLRIYSITFPTNGPLLQIASGANRTALLSWPAPSAGFVLQQTTNLTSPNWTTVILIPTVAGSSNMVTVPMSATRMFYRLTLMQTPPLAIARSGPNSVLISWAAAFTGFTLQQNSNLATTNWTAVTNATATVNGQSQVTISPATGTKFFRLIN
jgi:hypothetical protein